MNYDATENEMSNFVNSFIPKGTLRNMEWAKRLFSGWAAGRGKIPDIKSIEEKELSVELRKFYHDLSKGDGKLYTHVALRGIRAGLQRYLKSSPNPSNVKIGLNCFINQ